MTDQDVTPETQEPVLAAAAAERRTAPGTAAEAADLADKYDRMMRLAAIFDDAGEDMRRRAQLGTTIVADPAFADSAPLSPGTHAEAESEILAATTGTHGLLTRSIELDADALVLRATVLTYRWIDELQRAAYTTLGSIAGRAIGYLAPQVALGGAIVSAGLIETDALDRDGMAAYLSELADSNPELMEHVTSGGGGLLDGLQMRSILTVGVLAGERGRLAGAGGLRAIGVEPFTTGAEGALRDVAVVVVEEPEDQPAPDRADGAAPRDLTALMGELERATSPASGPSVVVRRVGASRYIAYLAGPSVDDGHPLRLVSGDRSGYAAHVVASIEDAVGADDDARVMLVGGAQGGVTAAEIAAGTSSDRFAIDQVITAGAPSAHVPRIPETTRMLSLEDRADPVALLGSLINAGASNRVTVVYDHGPDEPRSYVAGGRAADAAAHPDLLAELDRLRALGYLGG